MLRNSRRNSKTKLHESFLALSAAIIAAFYAMMGIILLVFPKVFAGLSYNTAMVFGSLLILYSTFRAYRAYKHWQEIK